MVCAESYLPIAASAGLVAMEGFAVRVSRRVLNECRHHAMIFW